MTNFIDFVHDADFKIVLQKGIELMEKQVSMLEQEALKYDVQLPNRPPASMKGPIDPETLTDRFMYSTILAGILSAVDMHIRAVLETIRNDGLRKIWLDLYNEELTAYDKFLKYGKAKGWTKPVPIYGEPVS